MTDPNPYQAPLAVDDAEPSPADPDLVDEIAIEAGRTRGPLLLAAIACGFPGGLALMSAALLLTSAFEDRLSFALPGGVLVIFTLFCTSLRANISTLQRRCDEPSAREAVKAYNRLVKYVACILLLLTLLLTVGLIAVLMQGKW